MCQNPERPATSGPSPVREHNEAQASHRQELLLRIRATFPRWTDAEVARYVTARLAFEAALDAVDAARGDLDLLREVNKDAEARRYYASLGR